MKMFTNKQTFSPSLPPSLSLSLSLSLSHREGDGAGKQGM